MIRPLRVSSRSAFLEQQCALCKEEFSTGDKLIICPEDGARHHVHCWEANGNKCSAFGCTGEGQIFTGSETEPIPTTSTETEPIEEGKDASKVRVLPSSSLGCAQGCILLSMAIAILVMAFGCFGLWAIADYFMINVLGFDYRVPFEGMIPPIQLFFTAFFG
jgi:hypothetical protein